MTNDGTTNDGTTGSSEFAKPINRIPFRDESGNEIFVDSYAVYLDALGTKARTGMMNDDQLRTHLEVLRHFKEFLHDVRWNDDSRQGFLQFSDNLILGSPINQKYVHGDLIFVISSASSYQFNLAVRGLLLRGAITRGQLYMDKEVVIGPAINEASEIEQFAVFPRIIVSQDCLHVIDSDREWSTTSFPIWKDVLLVDEDGEAFINYITTIEYDGVPVEVASGLDFHRKMIVKGLSDHTNGTIREKYVWLSHLHNFVIDEFYAREQRAKIGTPDLTNLELSNPRHFSLFPSPISS